MKPADGTEPVDKDELASLLSPEVQEFCQLSIEGAARHPELDADFLWPVPMLPGGRKADTEAVARHLRYLNRPIPPTSVILVITSLLLGGLAFDLVFIAAAIFGSMSWNRAGTLGVLITLPAFVMAFVIGTLTAIFQDPRIDLPRTIAGYSARTLTGLAVFAAGRRQGPALFAEWTGHLTEESPNAAGWAVVRLAAGFVVAGARCRGQDWHDAAWRPAEAVLRSRLLSGLVVATPTVLMAWDVLRNEGSLGVITSFGSIFGIGTALTLAINAGRKYRDVRPREPKPRRDS